MKAIDRQIPLLGICLGMQWMFESSREAPQLRGLGLFAGECEKFPVAVKSPHVGWNQLQVAGASRLLRGLPENSFVYFTHSYRAPWSKLPLAGASMADRFPRWWSVVSFLGCSFIPRNQERRGFIFCVIFVNCRNLNRKC